MKEIEVEILKPMRILLGGAVDVFMVFREIGSDRTCSMNLTDYTATVLYAAIETKGEPWPTPHSIILDMLKDVGGVINKIIVDRFEDSFFKASIHVTYGNGETKIMDATPPDAAILAVRVGCPVLMNDDFLKSNDRVNNILEQYQRISSNTPKKEDSLSEETALELFKRLNVKKDKMN
jgi:bifunctional DNase/RNase